EHAIVLQVLPRALGLRRDRDPLRAADASRRLLLRLVGLDDRRAARGRLGRRLLRRRARDCEHEQERDHDECQWEQRGRRSLHEIPRLRRYSAHSMMSSTSGPGARLSTRRARFWRKKLTILKSTVPCPGGRPSIVPSTSER